MKFGERAAPTQGTPADVRSFATMPDMSSRSTPASTVDAQTAPPAFLQKIVAQTDLPPALALLPRPLVFTNGVFDILHRGHVTYLAQARAQGASLVVGLNSDASARTLGKGPDRPLNAQDDRAAVLAALESVDLVVLFDQSTPLALLDLVRPDLYVKGGDYAIETLAETTLVRSWGGHAMAIPLVAGRSTTALVQRIRRHRG